MLRAALFHGASAVDAWRRLRARRDPEQVHVVAWELRPLLYVNLRRLGVRDPVVDAFKAAYRATWVRNEKSVRHLAGVLASLRDAGVETLLLKGGALALQYYGDLGLRPMGDLDVLVRPACAGEGIAALERLGWSCRYSLTASFLSVKHAAPFEDADGCNCDLHWRVFEEYCPPEADAEFWAAAVEPASPTVPARTLSPADQLLHVCVHGTKWAEPPGLRWIADAVHVLRAGGIDWERFARQAVARRFTLQARDALAYLRARLDAPVPAAVLTRLAGLPVSRLERFEFLLRQRPHRVLGELPLYWCNYRRSVEGRSRPGVPSLPPAGMGAAVDHPGAPRDGRPGSAAARGGAAPRRPLSGGMEPTRSGTRPRGGRSRPARCGRWRPSRESHRSRGRRPWRAR